MTHLLTLSMLEMVCDYSKHVEHHLIDDFDAKLLRGLEACPGPSDDLVEVMITILFKSTL
jgi:hypothetical protein